MKNQKHDRKARILFVAIALVGSAFLGVGALAAPSSSAQAQQTPATTPPPGNPQKPNNPQEANPFPEDTNSVPVLPSSNPTAQPPSGAGDAVPMPDTDSDPVRSPDDVAREPDASGASSSSAGLDNLLKPPPEDQQKSRHAGGPEIEHPESAKEDESVGSYYLDQKNWKGARSRFESALVLDPDNPDVYWGLAESDRHLGDFAGAKGNYLKVIQYDPDSKHGKEAKRILKEPDIESAKGSTPSSAAAQPH